VLLGSPISNLGSVAMNTPLASQCEAAIVTSMPRKLVSIEFRAGEKRARHQLPTSDDFALRKHQQSMRYARTEAQTACGSGQSDRIASQR
jgi:hypothetical protein